MTRGFPNKSRVGRLLPWWVDESVESVATTGANPPGPGARE